MEKVDSDDARSSPPHRFGESAFTTANVEVGLTGDWHEQREHQGFDFLGIGRVVVEFIEPPVAKVFPTGVDFAHAAPRYAHSLHLRPAPVNLPP